MHGIQKACYNSNITIQKNFMKVILKWNYTSRQIKTKKNRKELNGNQNTGRINDTGGQG